VLWLLTSAQTLLTHAQLRLPLFDIVVEEAGSGSLKSGDLEELLFKAGNLEGRTHV
jgi:hypothetical protein